MIVDPCVLYFGEWGLSGEEEGRGCGSDPTHTHTHTYHYIF